MVEMLITSSSVSAELKYDTFKTDGVFSGRLSMKIYFEVQLIDGVKTSESKQMTDIKNKTIRF